MTSISMSELEMEKGAAAAADAVGSTVRVHEKRQGRRMHRRMREELHRMARLPEEEDEELAGRRAASGRHGAGDAPGGEFSGDLHLGVGALTVPADLEEGGGDGGDAAATSSHPSSRPSPALSSSKAHGAFVNEFLAAVTLILLQFAFANVFALFVFEPDALTRHLPVGISMHLLSAVVSVAVTTRYSGCPAMIAAPDVNVTVFLAALATSISGTVAPSEALPTVLFVCLLGTLMVAASFYVLGRYRMTRIVQFMPASVLAGFLSCVGLAVLREAVVVASGFHLEPEYYDDIFLTSHGWELLLPAIAMGAPLYAVKRLHLLPTAVAIPGFLTLPLVVFYAVLAAAGVTVDDARGNGWFLDRVDESTFYDQWDELYSGLGSVDWREVGNALPKLFAMTLVVSMDFLLKLAGTEKVLRTDLDFDDEVRLAGLLNFACAAGAGVPAYGQLELTMINFGVGGSAVSRRPGYAAAAALLVAFFVGSSWINYLPRFYVAGLLLYAGLGLLVANLYDTRRVLSRLEWAVVWAILVIFFFFGLLLAVGIGITLAVALFAFNYGRRNDIKAELHGGQLHSKVVRPLVHRKKIEQLGVKAAHCLMLQGLLFFGSTSKIERLVSERLATSAREPRWSRLRFLLLDFSHVIGIDSSAVTVFTKIRRMCKSHGVRLLLTGLSPRVWARLRNEGVLDGAVDHTAKHVDDGGEEREAAAAAAAAAAADGKERRAEAAAAEAVAAEADAAEAAAADKRAGGTGAVLRRRKSGLFQGLRTKRVVRDEEDDDEEEEEDEVDEAKIGADPLASAVPSSASVEVVMEGDEREAAAADGDGEPAARASAGLLVSPAPRDVAASPTAVVRALEDSLTPGLAHPRRARSEGARAGRSGRNGGGDGGAEENDDAGSERNLLASLGIGSGGENDAKSARDDEHEVASSPPLPPLYRRSSSDGALALVPSFSSLRMPVAVSEDDEDSDASQTSAAATPLGTPLGGPARRGKQLPSPPRLNLGGGGGGGATKRAMAASSWAVPPRPDPLQSAMSSGVISPLPPPSAAIRGHATPAALAASPPPCLPSSSSIGPPSDVEPPTMEEEAETKEEDDATAGAAAAAADVDGLSRTTTGTTAASSGQSPLQQRRRRRRRQRLVRALGRTVHAFDDLDQAMEWVETHLLSWANVTRSKWLVMPNARKLHAGASFKALGGPFDDLFSAIDEGVWTFFRQERLQAGTVLCRPGDLLDRLYLLMSGRVSKYLENEGGRNVRIATILRGCATSGTLDLPCAETVIVDRESSFVTIDRVMLERMQEKRPRLAVRLQRAILNSLTSSQNHMERSLHKRHSWDAYDRLMERRERRAHRMSASISRFARNVEKISVWASGSAGAARPRRLDSSSTARAMFPGSKDSRPHAAAASSRARASSSVALAMYPEAVRTAPRRLLARDHPKGRPDFSPSAAASDGGAGMRRSASEASLGGMLAAAEAEAGDEQSSVSPSPQPSPGPPADGPLAAPSARFLLRISVHDLRRSCVVGRIHKLSHKHKKTYTEYFRAHASRGRRGAQRLPVKDLRHAVMDLGYYETADEIAQLVETELGPAAARQDEDGLDLDHFLHLMGRVTMADLEPKQVAVYEKVFSMFCSPDSGGQYLDAAALARLFRAASSHTFRESQLRDLVDEWGSESRGHLSFEEFLSVIAFSVKRQQVVDGVRREFARLADKELHVITPESLLAAMRRMMPEAGITEDEARELVYEADTTGDGSHVTEEDFSTGIAAVYQPAWIVMWDWKRRVPRRFVHDMVVDGEFEGMVDVVDEAAGLFSQPRGRQEKAAAAAAGGGGGAVPAAQQLEMLRVRTRSAPPGDGAVAGLPSTESGGELTDTSGTDAGGSTRQQQRFEARQKRRRRRKRAPPAGTGPVAAAVVAETAHHTDSGCLTESDATTEPDESAL